MKQYKLKIDTISTSRADFGILLPLISCLDKSKDVNHKLIVTGSHFLKKYGLTVEEVKEKNIKKIKYINFFKKSTKTNFEFISEQILQNFNKYFLDSKTDAIILLGDRFELLPIAYSALMNRIKIIHINGGEITSGAIDDEIRHSITKLSNLHLVSNKIYRRRVIQMGEKPSSVINTGYLGINSKIIKNLYCDKIIREKINIKNNRPINTIVLHPETKSKNGSKNIKIFFKFIKQISKSDYNFVISYPNIDYGNEQIIHEIEKLRKKTNIYIIKNFGHLNYLSLLKSSKVLIGNSSSGLLEAPYLKTYTLNVGNRQCGRISFKTIFNEDFNYYKLIKTYNKIMKKKNKICNVVTNMPIKTIIKKITNFKFSNKSFRDIKY